MFGKSITLFQLFGFRVKVDASWLLLALLVSWSLAEGLFPHELPGYSRGAYWLMGGLGVVGLVVSIVLHEFSHSLVARHYGLPIGGISLFVFGGVAEMEDEPPGAKSEFLMAAAGPLSSFVLAGVFNGLENVATASALPETIAVVLFYLAYLNVVLAIFNLVPAFPLDGGRMLRAVLWGVGKDLDRATRIAASMGQALGLMLMLLGVLAVVNGYGVSGLWWILIGLFLRAAAANSYGQLRIRESVQGIPVRTFMTPDPVTVAPDSSLQEFYEHTVYRHHHHTYPVHDGARAVGVVRANAGRGIERNLWPLRHMAEFVEPLDERNSIDADLDAARALNLMMKTGNSRLVVTEKGRLAGILTFRDLVAAQRLRDER